MRSHLFPPIAVAATLLVITPAPALSAGDLNCGKTYGTEDNGELARFDAELRHALSTKDVAQLSLLVSFPLRVNGPGRGSSTISDPRSLQDNYLSVFPAAVVDAVLTTAPKDVMCMNQGVMYQRGAVWVEPGVINGALVYRIQTVNLPDQPTAPLRKGEHLLEFVCETAQHRILVDSASDSSYRYRAWNKPRLVSEPPDVEIAAPVKARDVSGTGACAHEQWTFSREHTTYTIGGLGCFEEPPPDGTRGFVQVEIGGVTKSHLYCQ